MKYVNIIFLFLNLMTMQSQQKSMIDSLSDLFLDMFKLGSNDQTTVEHSWSKWGPCFTGSHSRFRLDDLGIFSETSEKCNPVSWSQWSTCRRSIQRRTRCDRIDCESESRSCSSGQLEWSSWSKCNRSVDISNRSRCSSINSEEQCETESRACNEDASMFQWSEWSECHNEFKTRERCNDYDLCQSDNTSCLAFPGWTSWSEWGPCVDGSKVRSRCDRNEIIGCEFMAMHCEVSVNSEWSEWGKCFLEAQSRVKCDGIDNCVNQIRKCSTFSESSLVISKSTSNNVATGTDSPADNSNFVKVPFDGEWSNWTSCSNTGVMNRTKCTQWGNCVGKYVHQCQPLFGCETEEMSCNIPGSKSEQADTSTWSNWSDCKNFEQERHNCDEENHCEVEFRICGMNTKNTWSDWSPCKGGSQERSSCADENVVDCATQERPCHNGFLGEWTEWSGCEGGFQERLICEEDFACEVDERLCSSNADETSWSDWNQCIGGTQSRHTCSSNDIGCQREERGCDIEQLTSSSGKWSEWTPCFEGFKSRELCEHGFSCEIEKTVCEESGEQSSEQYDLTDDVWNSVSGLLNFDWSGDQF